MKELLVLFIGLLGAISVTTAGTAACAEWETTLCSAPPCESASTYEIVRICAGESTLIFGEDRSDVGTYFADYVTAAGCDSTHAVTLLVNPGVITQASRTVCANEPVALFGTPLTSSGIYTETGQDVIGCDSTHTLYLTVLPVFATQETKTICSGGSTEVFGAPRGEPGEYQEVFVAMNGCDSVHTVLLVETGPVATQESLAICAEESILLFGEWVDAAGDYSATLGSSTGCDSVHTVILSVLPREQEESVVQICAGEATMIHGVMRSEPGFYYQETVTASGCPLLEMVRLEITELTVEAVQGIDQCTAVPLPVAGAVPRGGTPPYQYQWNNGASAQILQNIAPANYSVTVMDVTGCTGQATILIDP